MWSLTLREYEALRQQWERAQEFQAALHGAKRQKGPQYASHGQQMTHAERAIKTGGRVATQSVEDQKAAFAGMMEAAFAPRHQTYFEHPDGRRATQGEMEALQNGRV